MDRDLRHPKGKGDGLVVDAVQCMPCVGQVKLFHSWNETTVATIETTDRAGAKRAGVAIGFSKHDRTDGVATYSTIAEAEALVALIQNAILDARRIEAGEPALAPAGVEPPTVQ